MPPRDDGVTVLVALLRSSFGGLRRLGVDIEAVLDEARIDPTSIERPDARLPVASLLEFWRVVTKRTHPDIGLLVAEQVEPGALDVLDYAMRSAPTLLDALRRLCRYHRIVCTGAKLEFESGTDGGTLRHRLPSFLPVPRALREFAIAPLVVVGRQSTGQVWWPLETRFAYPKPARTAEHRRIFGPNVRFGCAFDELSLSPEALALPQRSADARLGEVLDRHLTAAVDSLPKASSFAARVRLAVTATLADEAPSIDRVARSLGVSRRTLTRRLAEEGTTFSGVVEELRAEMASDLLRERALGVSEVSYLLGFSEPSAFSRAFQRWKGTSPTEFRRGVRAQ